MPRRALSVLAAVVALVVAGCGDGRDGAAPAATTAMEAPATTAATEAPASTSEAATTSEAPPATVPAVSDPAPPAPTGTRGPAAADRRRQPEPAACPAVPPRRQPPPERPRYQLSAEVRLDDNAVTGSVAVRFTPDLATDRLVFRLWPNGPRTAAAGAHIEVGEVTVAGRAAPSSQPDATTLMVALATPLRPGQAVDVSVPWRLRLPGPVNDRLSRDGDAVRLGSFFPILAWEPGVGWATEPPSSGFAEASLAPVADFTATVSVPQGLDVLATGRQEPDGRWVATAVPDFAVSVGRFRTESRTVAAPGPVEVTVGVHAGITDAPGPYLDKVERVLDDFARRFGPYPWPSYVLAVTPGLGGGIEYPMLVMQGPGRIGRTTSHEVGHMWFYGLVGSNQGRDPWMDEGLATWAEARYESTLADIRSRSIPAAGKGRAGEPMTFWEPRQSSYYRSVYVQGAQALAALGHPDLVDCALRHYVAASAWTVARPADVIAAMLKVFPDAEEVLARYGIRSG